MRNSSARPHAREPALSHITSASIAGALDASSFLMYIISAPEAIFYSIIIALKVFLLAFTGSIEFRASLGALAFVTLALLFSAASGIANKIPLLASLQPFAALGSLLLSLSIAQNRVRGYMLGVLTSGLIALSLYLMLVFLGAIESRFGRMMYFGGSHPNLGGETFAVVAIVSCLILRGWKLTLALMSVFVALLLLQSRSAMVVALILIGASLGPAFFRFAGVRDRLLQVTISLAGMSIILIALLVSVGFESIYDFFSKFVFRTDDVYRGAGTGFSGRDQNWAEGFRLISEHPLLGVGNVDQYITSNIYPAHSWFMLPFVQYGLLQGGILISIVAASAASTYRERPELRLALIAFVPLLFFNARFISFNIYPFLFYFLIFTQTTTNPTPRKAGRARLKA